MALYGQMRDISMFRFINRELMWNIISEQVVFYKYNVTTTKVNMYGESVEGRNFADPVLLFSLIEVGAQTSPVDDFGVEFKWPTTFRFLRDDLVDANLHPEQGDIIMWQEGYWEIDNVNATQFFVGKDPDYPNSPQPSNPAGATYPLPSPLWNPGLDEFGYNVSIICQTAYVPADKVGITFERM